MFASMHNLLSITPIKYTIGFLHTKIFTLQRQQKTTLTKNPTK